jgi:hypothetical protein
MFCPINSFKSRSFKTLIGQKLLKTGPSWGTSFTQEDFSSHFLKLWQGTPVLCTSTCTFPQMCTHWINVSSVLLYYLHLQIQYSQFYAGILF